MPLNKETKLLLVIRFIIDGPYFWFMLQTKISRKNENSNFQYHLHSHVIFSLYDMSLLEIKGVLYGWLVGFYGISTFVGYLTPNPFLYK